jgi:hypothetical protein
VVNAKQIATLGQGREVYVHVCSGDGPQILNRAAGRDLTAEFQEGLLPRGSTFLTDGTGFEGLNSLAGVDLGSRQHPL